MKLNYFILGWLINSIQAGLDLTRKDNMVHYWGQNSYGSAHSDTPSKWEKDLSFYCNQEDVDVINLGFLNAFNAGRGLPEINFSNHCGTFFKGAGSKLRHCPNIAKDIKYCQKKGKTIILSLGGAIASTGFPSAKAASEFAGTLWNMFMEGNHKYRPFDDAIIDGIDLDLEGGSQDHYSVFLSKLQAYYKSGKKRYFVTSAPQCEFPDRNLQTIMEHGHIDLVMIQFYNNFCGVHNYGNPWAFNWPVWELWAKTKSFNKNIKLMPGIPSSKTAASTGYIQLPAVQKILGELAVSPTFAGVMLWDASQNEHSTDTSGRTFSQNIKSLFRSASKSSEYLTAESDPVDAINEDSDDKLLDEIDDIDDILP